MFGKKKCKNCGISIKDSFDFCPSCGKRINLNQEDWGMLGKNDSLEETNSFTDNFFGGFGGGMLGKMIGSTIKLLEKEMQKEMNNAQNMPNSNFELYVNGKRVSPDKIKITKKPIQEKQEIKQVELPKNKLKNFAEFKSIEPETNIRRLSDRIIYEMEMPGVSSINDLSMSKIGNSIEIKALAKDKSYFKILQIGLPVVNYEFDSEKLILEFEIRE